jgi:glycosyltransferase involved in cell wall biosynthesis
MAQKMESHDMTQKPRVLAVVPGRREDKGTMVFVRKQLESLLPYTVTQDYYFESRMNPAGLIKAWWDVRKLIKQHRPDIIHAHFGTITALLCAVHLDIPRVITYRGSDINPDRGVSRPRKFLSMMMSQLAALLADQIICVSPELKRRLWWKRSRAKVIPTGVDLNGFAPVDRVEARRQLDWPQDVPILLFAGRVEAAVKRFPLAREAYEYARSLLPELQFKVLAGEVRHQDMPLYYSAADCMILSSMHEGSPNVVKEALACNLPIVSVDVGDVRERLAGVYPSWIVEPDPRVLGERIVEAVRLGIRSNGRKSVESISQEKVAQEIVACYLRANPRLRTQLAAENPTARAGAERAWTPHRI